MASRVERLDTERMDFRLHGIAQCIVDQSMARQCGESFEIFGDYGHMEMTTTRGGAWMTNVQEVAPAATPAGPGCCPSDERSGKSRGQRCRHSDD